jgi:23S rRNA pseudouridine1911/1915/1917 synthase
VVRALFGLSWSKARDAVESGKVLVDGAVAGDVRQPVAAGAAIELRPCAPRRGGALETIARALVYRDQHLVVVAKPAGVSSVPFEAGERGSLKELVFRCLCRLERGRSRAGRMSLAVVHRLDKETSGLLVFARSWAARESLKQQFRAHSVHRRYLALVHGSLARDAFSVASHLVCDRGDGLRGSRRQGGEQSERGRALPTLEAGKRAVTHVAVLERLGAATLVACRLETGRTHQIRIHLAEAGHPLVGERVYTRDFGRPTIAAPRLMLHAAELGLVHPASGEALRWSLALPEDMATLLGELRADVARLSR